MLYCSLILPYLSYACEIWGNTYKYRLHTLMLVRKKAIRNIAKASYLDYTQPLEVFDIFRCCKIKNLDYNI